MMPMNKCLIWPDFGATISPSSNGLTYIVKSDRTGGRYEIGVLADPRIGRLSAHVRARLTTWLVDQRLLGNQCPKITPDIVEYAKVKRPLRADERAERLLKMIAYDTKYISSAVQYRTDDGQVYAWSESVATEDVYYLLGYLKKMSWIDSFSSVGQIVSCRVSVEGYNHLADSGANIVSSQAFVAMWFDGSMNDAFENGIKPAIESAGYKPLRIDRKPDVNKIDDAIIAEIRRSRFLVADFTHGKEGARGGVYFEAGFAHGLGIPVIYTCRKDMVDKLHFDTRQYAHIVWQDPKELHDELRNRILARIGEGPGDGFAG